MQTFSYKYIQRLIDDIGVYIHGMKIVDRVDEFEYSEDTGIITATVHGTYPYEVEIEMRGNDNIKSYRCECEAFKSCFGACKHIVAVLLYANQYFEEERRKMPFFYDGFLQDTKYQKNVLTDDNDFYLPISQLGINLNKKSQKVNLWIEQNIVPGTTYTPSYLEIHCKIGIEKPYKVKDFIALIEAKNSNKPLYYGKNFTFEPDTMFFSGVDKEVFEFIEKLYFKEKYEREFHNPYSHYNSREFGSVRPGRVVLVEEKMKNYLDIVKDSGIPVYIFQRIDSPCKIHDDLEMDIKIKEVDDFLVLEADYSKDIKIMPLTRDFELVLDPYKRNIYRISEDKARLLKNIHRIRLEKKTPVFKITKAEQQQFVRNFLKPYGEKLNVQMDESLKKKMAQKDLVAKVYFDAIENGISAKIEYWYEDMVINPLIRGSNREDTYYMRDFEKEERILDLLKSAGMYENDGRMVLYDEEEIAELFENKIEQLKELAEVYYSEDFKKIQIRPLKKVQVGVRLNTESELLEVDFDIDEFDDAELYKLFHSVREKKKYYRLKDGTILRIDSQELINVAKLIDDLSLDLKQFEGGVLPLPANRALFIDNYVNERKMANVTKNEGFKRLVHDITNPKDMEFPIDEGLAKILRDYQKIGYKWLKTLSSYGFGGILADDMGLGKTLQVLAFVKEERKKDRRPCLVVAPTSLVYNWKWEAEKFVPDLKVEVIHGTKAERDRLLKSCDGSDIIVTSYGSLKRDIETYRKMNFSYVFVDEAQHIKNPNTLNANSVKSLKARGYFALTGTPIENSLTELWSIFDFIMPGYLMSHNSFVQKFERPIVQNNDKEKLNTLSKFIKPFVLRRLKNDVLKELPEKVESKVIADMTSEQKKLYAAYLKQAQREVAAEIKARGIEKSKIKILALMMRLRQICCHPAMFIEDYKGGSGKMEALLEIVETSVDSGHRLLLFSQFTSMLEIIGKAFKESGKSYFYLDGSTKAQDRMDMVKRFNGGERDMFLISLKAGGTGLNLTGADVVVHYDPWWNPAVEDQATDRAYRIGQTKNVQVFKIITRGTIEEKIFEMQEKKRGLINDVIQPGETFLTRLSEEEIRDLFQI
ncbi:DEAD/DEAH box helicase [Acetivibrio clariflavus]|uniref:DNA/RNA helicase, superfamily II, SNF2 family n=1 Tax=Acetivibrio clariflavus (strain DSM 19732 / NBRC 101661 / EBR45) TaxID=720554 RepID=G8M335_ACECE|nr:DEAD/DEAH box helicase [Acetivibrio clariflavus]AEV69344.1 DNA/RNA helicase, superfamily II, SNF2 family [Acetivibrio clariflavus DSM 19732]